MLTEQERRPSRVPFRHPVRVETIDEPRRVIRTLSANLSKDGLFLRMPEPLAEGTRLLVSLEAKGCPHALAEAEVRWTTRNGIAGCGVLFTRYSHPRSKELLTHLVESIEHNRPLRIAGRPQKWRRVIATVTIALLVGGILAVLAPTGERAVVEQPVAVVAPPVATVSGANAPAVETVADTANAVDTVNSVAEALPVATNTVEVATAAPQDSAAVANVAVAPVKAPARRKHQNVTLTNARAPVKQPATLAEALKGAPPAVTVPRTPFGSTPTVVGSLRGSMKLPSGAAKSLSWDVSPSAVRFAAEGQVVKTMLLESPARAVIDVKGAKPLSTETLKLVAPHVKSLRLGTLPEGTRLVIDLDKAPTSAKPAGNAIVLTF